MTKLLWDQLGQRFYETGVDHGVLYLSDGSAVPWNGLTSVEEDFGDDNSTPYFLDGVKYLDSPSSGDFAATIKAYTYPDEFLEYEGIAPVGGGLFADDQPPKVFGLSYRTLIGNDVDGTSLGYKLHIIYNLVAVEDAQTFKSLSNQSDALEFSWKVQSFTDVVSGYRPTAHVVIDSRRINSYLLSDLEDMLYGTDTADASLMSFSDLVSFVENWHLITITDNGDGTWTASTTRDYITMLDPDTFQITQVDATYLDANTYTVTSTDTPQGA